MKLKGLILILFSLSFVLAFSEPGFLNSDDAFFFKRFEINKEFNKDGLKKIFTDNDISVYIKSTHLEKHNGEQVIDRDSLIIVQNDIALEFVYKFNGKISEVTKLPDISFSGMSVLKVAYTSWNSIATNGFNKHGEQYFLYSSTKLLKLISVRTQFDDVESNMKGSIRFYANNDRLKCFYKYQGIRGSRYFSSFFVSDFTNYAKSGFDYESEELKYVQFDYSIKKGKYFTLNDTKINLRNKPSLESSIIRTLQGDELFEIEDIYPFTEKIDNYWGYWVQIKLGNENSGWIWSKYIKQSQSGSSKK